MQLKKKAPDPVTGPGASFCPDQGAFDPTIRYRITTESGLEASVNPGFRAARSPTIVAKSGLLRNPWRLKKNAGPREGPGVSIGKSAYGALVPVNLKRWTTESGLSANFAIPVPVI